MQKVTGMKSRLLVVVVVVVVAMFMLCQPSRAAFVARGARGASIATTTTTRLYEGQERLNNKIDLDSPKVVSQATLEPGKKGVYCRCWLSEKFPLCDGTHAKHNEATGDNVGPLIVTAAKPE